MKVYLDSFHMIRKEPSFRDAVRTCGREFLGYVHVRESNRGIPVTGLFPWKELFRSLREIGYEGPMVIESFDPGFVGLNRLCAIWRKMHLNRYYIPHPPKAPRCPHMESFSYVLSTLSFALGQAGFDCRNITEKPCFTFFNGNAETGFRLGAEGV